jgi:hypothetical protein
MGSAIYAKMFKQELKYDESKEQDNPKFFEKDEDYMADRKAKKARKDKPIQLDAVDLGIVQTKKHYMPDSYEKGDSVDEDDFEDSFKAKGEFPQLSIQDYSNVKKDKQGKNYVTKLKEE